MKIIWTLTTPGYSSAFKASSTRSTLGEHERIYAAIATGDAVAAAHAMQLHLDGAAKRVGLPIDSV